MKRLIILIFFLTSTVLPQISKIPHVTLNTINGEKTTVEALLKHGPLLIDFWALWCAPCLKSMRYFHEFQIKYQDQGFNVLAINLDTERSRSKVRNYIKARGYEFLVALDPAQESFRRLNGNSMPYTLLIDKTGSIVYRHTGYVPGDEKKLEKEILSLFRKHTNTPTLSK